MHQTDQKSKKNEENDTDSRQSEDGQVKDKFNFQPKPSSIPSEYRKTSIKNLLTYYSHLYQQKYPQSLQQGSQKVIQLENGNSIWKKCALTNLQKIKTFYQHNQTLINEPISPEIEELIDESYFNPSVYLLQSLSTNQRFIGLKTPTQLTIHRIHSSRHRQIVTLDVQLLHFKTKICILNVTTNNPIKQKNKLSISGTFGSLYFLKALGQEIAIKLMPLEKITDNSIKDINKFITSMASVIEEYFFLIIFSHLQIGPKVKTIGGFDMIVYEDSVIFGTEICEQKLNKETIVQDLSESLMKMHTLRVVHRDIKPLNIMYSPSYKKNVFIDFGCAESLQQFSGQMSQTIFRGTPAFCTVQVLKLSQKKKGYVDLYLNDAYALAKSLQNIQMRLNIFKEDDSSVTETSDFDIIQLKYWLYHEAFDNFYEIWQKIKLASDERFGFFQTQLLKFLPQLNLSRQLNLVHFYNTYFSQTVRSEPQFRELAKIFSMDDFQAIRPILNFPEKQKQFKVFSSKYVILASKFSKKSPKCKTIQLILQNSIASHQFIKDVKFDWENNRFFGFQKKNMIQSLSSFMIDHIQLVCIICANYCSMSKNKYNVSFEKKVETISFVMEILESTKFINLQEFPFIFMNIIDTQMNLIGQFFQIYALKVSYKIPYELKQGEMVNCLSSLCVIGYVISHTDDIKCFQDGFDHVSESQKKIYKENDINLYLMRRFILRQQRYLICSCFHNKNMFYNRSNFRFLSSHNEILKSVNTQIQDQFFISSDTFQGNQLCHEIISCCSNFREIIGPREQNVNEDFLAEYSRKLLQMKEKHQKYEKKNRKEYSQWYLEFEKLWLIMALNFCHFSYNISFDGVKPFLLKIQHYFTPDFFEDNQLIYYNAYIFFFFQSVNVPNAQIFYLADQIINCPQISIRFKIQWRFRIGMYNDDFEIKRKVTQFLKYELQQRLIGSNQISNLVMMANIVNLFFSDSFRQFSELSNKKDIQLFVNLYDIAKLFLKLGYRYAKQTPNPNYLYEIDIKTINQKEIKNIYFENLCVSDYYYFLSKIVHIYWRILSKYQLNSLPFESIKSFFPQFQMDFQEDHLNFIQSLNKDCKVFDYATKFIQFVKNNQEARKTMKKSHYLLFMLMKNKNSYTDQTLLTPQLQEIFEELSHEHTKSMLGTSQKATNFYILFQKLTKQIHGSNFNSKLCLQMVELYRSTKDKNLQSTIFRQRQIFHCVIHSFIFSKQTYQQFIELLIDLTRILSSQIEQSCVDEFMIYLQQYFGKRNNAECFNEQYIAIGQKSLSSYFKIQYPQQWSFEQLSPYLIQSLKYLKPETQPYMALVYSANMWITPLQTHILKKFIFYILRALPFLPQQLKKFLAYKIYFLTYLASSLQIRQQILQKRGINTQSLFSVKFPLSEKNQSIHRKTIYILFKHKKNHYFYQQLTIDQFIFQMLFKQRYFIKYTIPKKFKDLYIKKLRRFIVADGRYQLN